MSSKKQVPVNKQKTDETPKKTQKSPSSQEKNDLAKQIKSLQSEIKRLTIENAAFKNKFDLKTIINELYQKGITELDPTEMAKDMTKMELEEADKRHSEEKKDMEKKHKKEIEKLLQKLQGEDQLPNHTMALQEADKRHSAEKMDMQKVAGRNKANDETPKETQGSLSNQEKKDLTQKIKNLESEIKRLSLENVMLKTKFDLREILQAMSQKGVQDLDHIEMTQDLVKMALETAEERHEAEKMDMKKEVVSLKADNDKLNNTIKQLKMENESLTNKLMEMTDTQLTLNNPNIDELSDAFRPTKLSEEYSQLYDNMWTDAFEEHNSKKEEDVIQMLKKGLLGSYEFCENVCREFTVQLTNSTLALPNSKPKCRLQDIPLVYKKQLQEIKRNFGVHLRNDVKESYRKKQNTIEGGDNTKNYIDACVELCWLMVIQNPPVVIETPASKDSAFDTNTYRSYTTTGPKVDFVVWPALRLHHGGPLLTKGVAQGKN